MTPFEERIILALYNGRQTVSEIADFVYHVKPGGRGYSQKLGEVNQALTYLVQKNRVIRTRPLQKGKPILYDLRD